MACGGEWPRVHVVLGVLGQRTGTETHVFDCVKAAKIISRAAKGVRAVARIRRTWICKGHRRAIVVVVIIICGEFV